MMSNRIPPLPSCTCRSKAKRSLRIPYNHLDIVYIIVHHSTSIACMLRLFPGPFPYFQSRILKTPSRFLERATALYTDPPPKGKELHPLANNGSNKGQKPRSQSVLYSEVPLYYYTGVLYSEVPLYIILSCRNTH